MSLGASDVASLDGFVGGVKDGGSVNKLAPAWPKYGQLLGHSMVAMAATCSGSGGWWWW